MTDLASVSVNITLNGKDSVLSGLNQVDTSISKQVGKILTLERNYKKLDAAFNSNKISAQQYAAGIQQLDAAIEALSSGIGQAVAGQTRFAKSLEQSQKAARRSQLALQQAGYQVGDFFVQVASGTSPMIAFTQQATQLVSFFGGPWGAVIGAALSIFGAMSVAIIKTKIDMSNLGDYFGVFSDQVNSAMGNLASVGTFLIDSLNSLLNNLDRVVAYGTAAAIVFGSQWVVAVTAAAVAAFTLEGALIAVRWALVRTGIGALIVLLGEAILWFYKLVDATGSFGKALSLLGELADEVWKGIAISAGGLVSSLGAVWKDIKSGFMYMLADLLTAWKSFLDGIAASASSMGLSGLAGKIGGAADSAAGVIGGLNQSGSDAAVSSESLRSRSDTSGAFSGATKKLEEINGLIDSVDKKGKSIDVRDWFNGSGKSGKGGSGGSSGLDKLENQLRRVYEYLGKTDTGYEAKALEEKYNQYLDVIKSARENQLITMQEYNQLEYDLMVQHQDDLRAIKSQADEDSIKQQQDLFKVYQDLANASSSAQLGAWGNFFGSMANLAQSGNEKILKIQKAFVAAQALMDAWGAYNKVLNSPGLTWWARIPAAVNVLAAGFGAVNAIKGISASGGSSSGGSSASHATSTISSTTTQAAPQTVYLSGLDPNAFYSGEQLQNLFDAFYDENDKRGKVFVVART